MKVNLSLSVDSVLLAEARGAGLDGKFSKFFEDALRERIHKPLNSMEREEQEMQQLKELRVAVHQKAQLFALEFKKVLRKKTFLGMPKNTIADKIAFWSAVLNEMP